MRDDNGAQVVQRELEPGERVLWSGRPQRGLPYDDGIGCATIFLVAWTGMLIAMAFTGPEIGGVIIVPLGMALVGVGMLVCVHVVVPGDHANLVYGVTDRRVLIIYRWLGREVDAYTLRRMEPDNVVLTAGRHSLGTVGFADFSRHCGNDNKEVCMPEFISIRDAPHVAELVRAAIVTVRSSAR